MSDEEKIKSVLDSFYSTISGNAGEEREWENLKKLFSDCANFTPYNLPDDLTKKAVSYNTSEYIERLKKYFLDHDFYERGFNYKIDIYGNIASVYSEYKSQIKKKNDTYMKSGINLVQLLFEEDEWKIVSMLWENLKNMDDK